MEELVGGIRRVTMPLPTRPGHVHAYLLPGEDGWTLVDTGIGLPDAKETWAAELEQLEGDVVTVFITHFHPDHIGAAADLHELTGAPVVQGALDYAQCELVWGNPVVVGAARGVVSAARRTRRRHGRARRSELGLPAVHPLPARPDPRRGGRARRRLGARRGARARRRPALPPPRRRADRCRPSARAHHADGRALAGEPSRPAGRLPRRARPHDRARSRDRVAGPRRPDRRSGGARAGAARSITACGSRRRSTALNGEPQTGYVLSFALFGADLPPAGRRFAVAETLSHLERLVHEGAARRHEADGAVTYTAA